MPSRHADLRILVLSNAVPQTWFAGSLLLYRLLQFHPPDRMKAVGPLPQPLSETLACDYAELLPSASSRLDLTRLAQCKRSVQMVSRLGRIPDRRVDAAVGGFVPDVVVSVMERFDYVEAAYRFSRRRQVPLALIVHDRLESFERVFPAFRDAQRRRIAAIYRHAACRLCVSPEMVECLDAAYRARGTLLYPSRSDALTPRSFDDSLSLKTPETLTIGYAGALNYGYGERIAQVMPVLANAGVRLRSYSREAPPAMPGVEYAGFHRPDELWAKVKAECDMVWLPYSYSHELRSLYETHFPSKLTEYVGLGMPVLITGPSYATGVRWGLRHRDAALTLADESPEQVRDALVSLRRDHHRRRHLAASATSAGDADFDPARIRASFFDALQAAAS